MKGISNAKNLIIKFITNSDSELVNIFFWLFLVSFLIDRIINYFIHFPFFVGVAILAFPFLFIITQYKNTDRRQLMILVFSFVLITIINSIVYLFGVKNISYLLFIILFITIYYYYKENINNLKILNIYLFFLTSFFLFSFTFINIDSKSIKENKYSSNLNWITAYDETPEKVELETSEQVELETSEQVENKDPKLAKSKQPIKAQKRSESIKWKTNSLDVLEALRIYHIGLFRLPHVASYFFGFLFLFFAYQYQKNKDIVFILLLVVSLGMCIYSGSRAILVAFMISVIIFLFNRKHIVYLALLLTALLILIVSNEYLLQLTRDTIFFQYFAFIKTSFENFSRLSRYRIWYSWWIEVREFNFLNFMIGKSYMNALYANSENLNYKVWFHNDFLNIFFSFGSWGTALYIWFFTKIYRDNSIYIRQNIFIFIFYVSMIITAVINGFYYYFPVFLLYLFLLMIKNEKQIAH